MKRTNFCLRCLGWGRGALAAVFVLVANSNLAGAGASPGSRPNFIFILIDDLGWADLGCYGSSYHETPHLDSMAAQGMRFTSAYAAAPVCSPTRAGIMTGKYPARLHLTDYIPGNRELPNPKLKLPEWRKVLPLEERTLAESLRAAGYRTAAVGKWHLSTWGADRREFFPDRQGFDRNIGGSNVGQPPSFYDPYKLETLSDGTAGEHLTDRLTAEALRFIEASRDRPFFLYLSHYAVHNPIQPRADLLAKYQAKPPPAGSRQTSPGYAAFVEGVDQSVGRVLAKLEELGLADNTVVIFTSDNGGLVGAANTSNFPLRGGKHFCYEGGIRVPLIVRWPARVPRGRASDVPVMSIDLLPTMLEWAGAPIAPDQVVDGASLAPLIENRGTLPARALFWHYPHYIGYRNPPHGVVRDGDFKLIEFFETGRVELYHLRDDVAEAKDLAAAKPDVTRRLRERLQAWRRDVGAQMPARNPDYDPAKGDVPPPKAK